MSHQSGVTSSGTENGFYIIMNLVKDANFALVRKHLSRVPELVKEVSAIDSACRLDCVVGLGFSLTGKLFGQSVPAALKEYKGLTGPGGVFPATGGDLLFHIKSDRKDLCYELGRRIYKVLKADNLVATVEETWGFEYLAEKGFGKDLSGFEDGPNNPRSEEAKKTAALIGQEDPAHMNGSFCFTQKWIHDLEKWESFPQSKQEQIIGRTKGAESSKVRPKEEFSHVSRTDIKDRKTEVPIKIVRQSMPFGGVKYHGLFFIAYTNNPVNVEKQLVRMIGNEGPTDGVLQFSRAVSGNYWYVPSLERLKLVSNL